MSIGQKIKQVFPDIAILKDQDNYSVFNDRQIKAVLYVKENGKITNSEYQSLNECSRNTASAELNDLVDKSVLQSSDVKGAGSFYQLCAIAQ